MKALLVLVLILGAAGALIFLRDTGGSMSLHPDLVDAPGFVKAAREIIVKGDETHATIAEEALPPALKSVPHRRVQVTHDHLDFVTVSGEDGQLGYRVWRDKPTSPDRPTKHADVFYLNVNYDKPEGSAENFP